MTINGTAKYPIKFSLGLATVMTGCVATCTGTASVSLTAMTIFKYLKEQPPSGYSIIESAAYADYMDQVSKGKIWPAYNTAAVAAGLGFVAVVSYKLMKLSYNALTPPQTFAGSLQTRVQR